MAYASAAPPRPATAPRLRPGERPAWWNAVRDRSHFDAWRAAAAARGVGVDALVAVLLELDLALVDLRVVTTEPIGIIESALCPDAGLPHLAPGRWRDSLAPGSKPYEFDELPELVLPERLTARLTPGSALHPRVYLELADLAFDADREAARHGRTLESWALNAALQASRTTSR